ncbi:MAG: aminotransferase class V-fold PLP-dependent enzyme, partial [Calditrichales bacterium]
MNPLNSSVKTPIESRNDFPSLKRTIGTYPLMYFDGPGGTQIPTPVIDAMVYYYHHHNANTHGFFVTTQESDKSIEEARKKMAVFLGAPGSDQISFGANMTTLAYSLSNAFGRAFDKGEEVLITQLDHEANRGPWLKLAERGIVVKEVNLLPDGTLDYTDFNNKITSKTRLVAMGLSSNALGTVNDTKKIIQKVRSV